MNVPNPVQRRYVRTLASDDLLTPCADEGGTFRAPAPARMLHQERDYSLLLTPVPGWISACVVAGWALVLLAMARGLA